jgi:endonuclease/exonuclease/phosphatase family metal-dependent hydrolase
MSDSSQLIVATVNTYLGRAVVEDHGLAAVAKADVLLLQELFNPVAYGLAPSLHRYGFEVLAAEGHFGLGIALRSDSDFRPAVGPPRSTVLQQAGAIESTLITRFSKVPLEYSDLGILAVRLQTPAGRPLVIATTHAPVVTSFRQRGRFLALLATELADEYYDGLLIVTGDMNHYPGPKKADLGLRRRTGLTAVDLSNEITWPARRTTSVGRRIARLVGGQLDDILHRGTEMEVAHREVVDIASDHRAVVATFTIGHAA